MPRGELLGEDLAHELPGRQQRVGEGDGHHPHLVRAVQVVRDRDARVDQRCAERINDVIEPFAGRCGGSRQARDLPVRRVEDVTGRQEDRGGNADSEAEWDEHEHGDAGDRERRAEERDGVRGDPPRSGERGDAPGEAPVDPSGVGGNAGAALLCRAELGAQLVHAVPPGQGDAGHDAITVISKLWLTADR